MKKIDYTLFHSELNNLFKKYKLTDVKKKEGIYQKFLVYRTDRKDAINEKHFGCKYFVLDLTHDEFAPDALIAYAEACKTKLPELSKSIKRMIIKGLKPNYKYLR